MIIREEKHVEQLTEHAPTAASAGPSRGESRQRPPENSNFAAWQADAIQDARAAEYEKARRGIRSGDLCGRPLLGTMPVVLLALLERLGWTPCCDALAKAMPHLPENFDLPALREICERLGYSNEVSQLRTDEIPPSRLPGLVLAHEPLIIDIDASGHTVAIDPITGGSRKLANKQVAIVFFDISRQNKKIEKSWFWCRMREFTSEAKGLFLYSVVVNLLALIAALSIMLIFTLVLPPRAHDTLVAFCVGAFLVVLVDLSVRRAKAAQFGRLSHVSEYRIATEIFSKILSLPMERLYGAPISAQIGRLRQFERVREIFSGRIAATLVDLPFSLMFIAVLFVLLGLNALVPVSIVLISALAAGLLLPSSRRHAEQVQTAQTRYDESLMDTLTSLNTIRNLGCEQIWEHRLDQANLSVARTRAKALSARRLITGISSVTTPLAVASTVFVGALAVLAGEIQPGALIASMILVTRAVAPIQQTLLMLPKIAEIRSLGRQMDHLMALPGETRPGDRRRLVSGAANISFRGVQYRYATGKTVIAGLSFEAFPGECIAVTGTSGCGKSTMLRLAQAMITPQSGVVSFNGVNLRQFSADEIRSHVGFAPQVPVFFHGTVAQNLRLAAPGASDSALWSVMDELGIAQSVARLPNGADTRLTESRQARLPRGVRQALSIARLLLLDRSVLLLDEPEQGLDSELDARFWSALSARRGKSTILMVSHRPSHIAECDRVIDLEQGKISAPKRADPNKVPDHERRGST